MNIGFRSYGAIASEQTLPSNLPEADTSVLNDEIAQIRREFDAAKQSFLKIPAALKAMPKMNPKGLTVHSCYSVEASLLMSIVILINVMY